MAIKIQNSQLILIKVAEDTRNLDPAYKPVQPDLDYFNRHNCYLLVIYNFHKTQRAHLSTRLAI